jgi:hypothetical protein
MVHDADLKALQDTNARLHAMVKETDRKLTIAEAQLSDVRTRELGLTAAKELAEKAGMEAKEAHHKLRGELKRTLLVFNWEPEMASLPNITDAQLVSCVRMYFSEGEAVVHRLRTALAVQDPYSPNKADLMATLMYILLGERTR